MRQLATSIPLSLLGLALALGCSDGTGPTGAARPSLLAVGRPGFTLNGTVSGAAGEVRLTGGGSYDPATASDTPGTETSVAAAGGFRCATAIAQGALQGCQIGEGVRWDTERLLVSSPFKCIGSETLKTATTDAHTAVLLAEFYRAGDGEIASFTAAMFVADSGSERNGFSHASPCACRPPALSRAMMLAGTSYVESLPELESPRHGGRLCQPLCGH